MDFAIWIPLISAIFLMALIMYMLLHLCVLCLQPSPLVQRYLFSKRERDDAKIPSRSRLVSICEIYPRPIQSNLFIAKEAEANAVPHHHHHHHQNISLQNVPEEEDQPPSYAAKTNFVILCPSQLLNADLESRNSHYLPPTYDEALMNANSSTITSDVPNEVTKNS